MRTLHSKYGLRNKPPQTDRPKRLLFKTAKGNITTAKNGFNVASLAAMLEALGYSKVVAPIKASKAATKAAPVKASKASVTPIKTSKAAKVAKPVEKGTITDADLLDRILKMSPDERRSAFHVMIILRRENISSSRVRINRVIREWDAEQKAADAAKAAKSAARKAKKSA